MARPADPTSRSALIAAARAEFAKHGIKGARIEDITHAVGLSKGAFYLHFESKEALLRELVSAIEAKFVELGASRAQAWADLLTRQLAPEDFAREVTIVDGCEDQKLLETLWDWRDVTDALLRGSQGTEFANTLWELLDREVVRVVVECEQLKRAQLIRDDVPLELAGMMMVGTYLLVARRFATLTEKPDFTPWISGLHRLMTTGLDSEAMRQHRKST